MAEQPQPFELAAPVVTAEVPGGRVTVRIIMTGDNRRVVPVGNQVLQAAIDVLRPVALGTMYVRRDESFQHEVESLLAKPEIGKP